jgi:site-specific DNA recombinase
VSRTRTVAYLRVSTDKQADHGVSLDAQRAKVEAYAMLYDLELVEIIVDAGESAKTLNRPGVQRALGMLKSGKVDALLVVKLDRLVRSVRLLADLVDTYFRDGKRALLSVTEQVDTRSAMGRGILNIIAALGQMEAEQVGERTAVAMAHKQAKGEYIGGNAPYGYALVEGALVPVEAEQTVIATARDLRAAGLSLRAVGSTLAEGNMVARNGRAFAANQIARMCEVA